MSKYKYKETFKKLNLNDSRKLGADLSESFNMRDELNEVYAKAEAWMN